jgi:hypothetical protein
MPVRGRATSRRHRWCQAGLGRRTRLLVSLYEIREFKTPFNEYVAIFRISNQATVRFKFSFLVLLS